MYLVVPYDQFIQWNTTPNKQKKNENNEIIKEQPKNETPENPVVVHPENPYAI